MDTQINFIELSEDDRVETYFWDEIIKEYIKTRNTTT